MRTSLALPTSLLSLVLAVLAQTEGSPQDYAPNVNQSCPDVTVNPLIRLFTPENQTLHPNEAQYVESRLQHVFPQAWVDWIGDGSSIGYNKSTAAFFQNNSAKIAIGISGGGLKAAQFGAGVLSGLDARNDSAKQAGTGGLLQVTSYLAGLSGGSWVTGSLVFNDFPTMEDLVFGNDQLSGWILDNDLAAPDGLDLFTDDNQYFFGSILWSVVAKADKWIDTSITDPWSRMISYHFLNQTTRDNFFTNLTGHGAGQLWSHIPSIPSYQQQLLPFPILMADSRPVGSNLTTALSPEPVVYEITPLEFGSWDPNLSAMMNMTYAGTHLTNGVPDNDTSCVTAFDQAGYMMGTSASLFNQILDFANNKISSFGKDGQALLYTLQRMLQSTRSRAEDVANWPNPFHGVKNDTFEDSGSKWLELIDGSSNAENVPFGPLFVKARGMDMVVAIDSSQDDAQAWPNGSSLVFTAARLSSILNTSHQAFPPAPTTPDEYISTGTRRRPTLFGCNPTQNPPEYPLVLYLPNSPPLNGDDPVTNTATFQIQYTLKHSRLFMDQSHANTIGGFLENATLPDPQWGVCLQCAAVDRARFKATPPIPRSQVCAKCFTRYCFDPAHPPNGALVVGRKLNFVDPDPTGIAAVTKFFSDHKIAFIVAVVLFAVAVAAIIGWLIWRRKRRDRHARYQKVDLLLEGPWVKTKVFDPYAEEMDFRTSTNQMELETAGDNRRSSYRYSRGPSSSSSSPLTVSRDTSPMPVRYGDADPRSILVDHRSSVLGHSDFNGTEDEKIGSPVGT
ncbi:phospholipase B [Cytidiella melzeri]|nr:phospholipase B [Cytidiella melzeri]